MIVLGINETHCATAAVLRDGAIVGCASEERFSRLKNDAGYPRAAVDALLADLGIKRSAVDLVVLAGARAYSREWMNRVVHDDAYARDYYGVSLDAPAGGLRKRARKLGARLGLAAAARGKFVLSPAERLRLVTDHLGIA
ncbi:MAG TPA: carbamoyltransferase N-terminal domain-containing protein, partial [Thermoanaerobaculia bacterium]|nr:carbamoyltransferase N-terminal domain-containing protein [Thermoanaerobaculia bacterium]